MGQRTGLLILNKVPKETSHELALFLSQYVQGNGKNLQEIQQLLEKTPLILKREIEEKVAQSFIEKLSAFRAEVVFIPSEESPSPGKEESKTSEEEKEGQEIEAQSSQGVLEKEKISHFDDDPLLKELFQNERKETPLRQPFCKHLGRRFKEELYRVNREIWLILSMVSIVALMNFIVDSQRLFLSFYTLPTVLSAYYFGRRHAVLTAFASIILILSMLYFLPKVVVGEPVLELNQEEWREFVVWGGVLIITGYAMGTLYERYKEKIRELQKTYQGILVILRHFISKDEYTENHCYRVSVYAAKIAQYLGLPEERIEDLRAAALLHDIGKLKISREILYKAAKLSQEEFEEVKRHVTAGNEILEPIKGTLGRIIPIILYHHERCDGKGYLGLNCENVPLEAKILAVADVYDALISDRPYRKGLPPFEAKEIIVNGAGKHFDPKVVEAFVRAFDRGEMDLPNFVI